ncbi:MAG: hypothetical protein C4583_19375 [Anaerolineaceae bacterium]|nr:MAG: hypothetical protein C4583_19375 [Anaerolineaceae bacterium]
MNEKQSKIKEHAFEYQLRMLEKEIDNIEHGIARFDDHTRAIRNWTVLTWTGAVAAIISQVPQYHQYIGITAIIPLLFWLVDARWTFLLRAFVYRQDKIAEFLNGPNLITSFQRQELVNFKVMDARAKQHRNESEFKRRVNYRRAFFGYRELIFFYGSLILVSLALELFFLK